MSNTTAADPASRRTRRALGATMIPALVLLAVACGTATDVPDAPASRVAAARGSDRHLELRAGDVADQASRQLERATYGSDRHFGVIAELAAAARLRAVQGSDRHLLMLANDRSGWTAER